MIILQGYDQQNDHGVFWQLAATPIDVVMSILASIPKIGQMKMISSLPQPMDTACADQLKELSNNSAKNFLSNCMVLVLASPTLFRAFRDPP